MKLTIGIPSYNNYKEVWFTIQSLINYHNLNDCEILVIDNFGDEALKRYIARSHIARSHICPIRYVKCASIVGSAYVRNKVFENALGDMVLCMDSHVLLMPGFLDNISYSDNLIHGPMVSDAGDDYCEWAPIWGNDVWGMWGAIRSSLELTEPFDIWGMSCQLFLTSKAGWLKFNDNFRGWGGEVGYIHEKYRQAGRRVVCDPRLRWQHFFRSDLKDIPYHIELVDRVRNYLIGFDELKLKNDPIIKHFDKAIVKKAKNRIILECLGFQIPEVRL